MTEHLFSVYSVLLLPISVAVSVCLCLLARPIAEKLRILDMPGGRKSHSHETPLMGGVVLLIACHPWLALWVFLNQAPAAKIFLPIIFCSSVITALGMLDDRFHLSAPLRLAVCFASIGLTIFLNPRLSLDYISWNFGAGQFSLRGWGGVFSTLSIVALIQGANLADGKNGLLIGLCLGWIFFLGNFAPTRFEPILLCTAAVLIVLLIFNLSGKLFLGDGGSYGLATLVGLLALLVSREPAIQVASDQIALIFLLPVMDMLRLVMVRAARGQSPFAGDRDHLHHHLLSVFGWPGGLAVYLLLACLPSFAAGGAPRWTLSIIALTVIAYLTVIYVLEAVIAKRNLRQGRDIN